MAISSFWTNPSEYDLARRKLEKRRKVEEKRALIANTCKRCGKPNDSEYQTCEACRIRLREGNKRYLRRVREGIMTETQLKEKVLARLLKDPDIYAIKTVGAAFGKRGTPDILGCYRDGMTFEGTFDEVTQVWGQMFAIELKTEGGKATPQQRAELEKWARAGAITGVCHSVEEVETLLELKHGE